MLILCLLLNLPLLADDRPEAILWNYQKGQEFFIQETQRQLLQVKTPTAVTSYLDVTYLWRYFVVNQLHNTVTIEATLEKIRVNNPNETGGKASELIKLKEGTKSTWILTKDASGWKIASSPAIASSHAVPRFLTLGTSRLSDSDDSWKETWSNPLRDWGQAQIQLTVNVRQKRDTRLFVNAKGQWAWQPDAQASAQVTVQPHSLPAAGLGEFDLSKGYWNYFEFRVDGQWTVTSSTATVTMRQDLYCHFRYSERRPVFP